MIRLHSRVLWLFVLVIHVVAAGGWLLAMPGGFEINQSKLWANRALPTIALVAFLLAIVAARAGRYAFTGSVLASLTAAYASAAVVCWVGFPVSRMLPFCVALVAVCVIALAACDAALRGARGRTLVVACVIGGPFGVAITLLAMRAPSPTTQPSGALDSVARSAVAPTTQLSRAVVPIGSFARVHPGDGSLDVSVGRLSINLYPLLTFVSRAPDRGWTCFTPRALREGPSRTLASMTRQAEVLDLSFADDGVTTLHVDASMDDALRLVATSVLPAAVFSHLNTFCELHVAGHRKLSLAFSPCPDFRVEITPQDTAPARFAYFDARGTFHVAQAARGEKGPFHDLAIGPMSRGDPLTITLLDEGVAVATVTLDDWSRQLSTDPSPTAGWGVPQNTIEFALNGQSDRAAASIYVTLAATSVGRGFDSVGHAAGTYVNRIEVRPK